jgi:elongation factor P
MQYLYRDASAYVFMDTETYEQVYVESSDLGQSVRYLKEGDSAVLPTYNGQIVGVELPAAVELTVTETEPGIQGDRVSGATKPATLETGAVVQVPLFINPGERIKVDTRTGAYSSRA